MIFLSGGRWWRTRRPVGLHLAVDLAGTVLLAVGGGNYVEMGPATARELAKFLNNAAAEAEQAGAVFEAGQAGQRAAESALTHALTDPEGTQPWKAPPPSNSTNSATPATPPNNPSAPPATAADSTPTPSPSHSP